MFVFSVYRWNIDLSSKEEHKVTGNNRPEVAAVDEDHIAEGGGAHSEHRLHGGVKDV